MNGIQDIHYIIISISIGYIIIHCFNGIPGELEAMKLTDLKEICRSNSLPVSGTKAPAIFGPVWLETSQTSVTSVAVSWVSLLVAKTSLLSKGNCSGAACRENFG